MVAASPAPRRRGPTPRPGLPRDARGHIVYTAAPCACGNRRSKHARVCRACSAAARRAPARVCPDCAMPRVRGRATRCRACYETAVGSTTIRSCEFCREEFTWQPRRKTAGRFCGIDCVVAARRSAAAERAAQRQAIDGGREESAAVEPSATPAGNDAPKITFRGWGS